MNVRLVFLSFLIPFFLLGACGEKDQQDNSEETTRLGTDEQGTDETDHVDDVPFGEKPSYDMTRKFKGSIAEKYPIEMELDYEGNEIKGTYFYTSQKKPLKLEGIKSGERLLRLKEFDESGNHTGTFSIYPVYFGIHGYWIKPDKSDSLDFEIFLTEEVFYVDKDVSNDFRVTVSNLSYTMEDATGNCKYDESRPQFSGLKSPVVQDKLNEHFKQTDQEEIKKTFVDCDGEFGASEESLTYDIISIGKGIVSVSDNFFSYSGGAAHGNYGSETVNLSLENGEPLSPNDLFADGFEAEMNRLILEKIAEEFPDDGLQFETVGPDQNYEIYPDRIETYFNPYEIGPYVLGQIRFTFSYDEIKDMIRPDGPLARFL